MLAINDLVMSKEMDKGAMAAVAGGRHGIGNYSSYYHGAWRRTYARAFIVHVRRGHSTYRAVQYQFTYKRYQTWYRGQLRYLGRV